jgi:hypothetical protein
VYELISIKIEQALERRRSSLATVRRLENFAKVREIGNVNGEGG